MNFKVCLSVLMTLLALTACHKSSDEPTTAVTPQNLTGNWEVTAETSAGKSVPASTMTSAASDSGYSDSHSKLQYQISAIKFKVISSDEVSVTYADEKDYKMDGNKLVPQNSADDAVTGFEVVSLTANNMIVKPGGKSDPADLQLTLARIKDADLATNKLKPIDQNMSYKLKTAKGELEDSFAGSFPAKTDVGDQISIDCSYKKSQGLSLSMYIMHITDKQMSRSSDDPMINVKTNVMFDFSKPTEELTTKLTPSESQAFHVIRNKDLSKAQFDLESKGSCSIRLKRNKRELETQFDCAGTALDASANVDATLTMDAKCMLRF